MRTDFGGLDLAPLVLIIGLQIMSIGISLIFNTFAQML
jgi:energy-converting hydrogenase Eha subunit E